MSELAVHESQCKICQQVAETPALAELIAVSTSPKALAAELDLPYHSLVRHMRNHIKAVAPVKEKKDYEEIWDTVLEKGLRRIKNEDIKVNLQSILKVAKDKSDYEAKQDDTQLEAAKLMYEFASGERTEVIEGEVARPSRGEVADAPRGTETRLTG